MRDVDVLVVGGGHLGLTTALGLARAGVSVEVLDTVAAPRLPSTAVHHWSVLAGLERLGVLDRLVAAGRPSTSWGLRVLATGESLDYDLADLAGEVAHPFNLHLEEPALRAELREALAELPHTTHRPGAQVLSVHQHPAGVTAEVADEHGTELVRARWVVAADGTSSVVRRLLGIGFEGTTWTERCVVALVDHDLGDLGYPDTTFVVDGTRGAVAERVDGTRWRYLHLEPLGRDEEGLAGRLAAVLAAATHTEPPVLDWTSTRMHQRSAPSFREHRVLLLGEAAHVTHDLIGHTPISGWFDAFTLGQALADVLGGGLDDAALDDWAAERRRVFLDDATPASLSRKHLVTQIRDPRRLDVELEHFRQARVDSVARREVLLQGRELEGVPTPGRPGDSSARNLAL